MIKVKINKENMKTNLNSFKEVIDLGQKQDDGFYRYHELLLTTIEGESIKTRMYLDTKPSILESGYVMITDLIGIVPIVNVEIEDRQNSTDGLTNDKRILSLYHKFLDES